MSEESDFSKMKQATEDLLRACEPLKVLVAGFVMGYDEDKFIINFGNTKDHGDIKLYEILCEMAQDARNAGHAINAKVTPVN